MVSIVLVPAALLLIYWVIIRGPRFSSRRGSLRATTLTGNNAGLMFAVFGLGQLLLSIADGLDRWRAVVAGDGELLGALGAVVIVALVLIPRAEGLLSLIGALTGTAGVFIEHGAVAGILFLVVVMLMLMLLGLIRGLAPAR